jgi:hypothetical protein
MKMIIRERTKKTKTKKLVESLFIYRQANQEQVAYEFQEFSCGSPLM